LISGADGAINWRGNDGVLAVSLTDLLGDGLAAASCRKSGLPVWLARSSSWT
jgi:hypothetical protein